MRPRSNGLTSPVAAFSGRVALLAFRVPTAGVEPQPPTSHHTAPMTSLARGARPSGRAPMRRTSDAAMANRSIDVDPLDAFFVEGRMQ